MKCFEEYFQFEYTSMYIFTFPHLQFLYKAVILVFPPRNHLLNQSLGSANQQGCSTEGNEISRLIILMKKKRYEMLTPEGLASHISWVK